MTGEAAILAKASSDARGRGGREFAMVLITSLVISFLAMDRLATGYIGPYLISDLDLTITQLGSLYSVQAMAVAASGILIGRYSDKTGMRKRLLVPLLALAAVGALAAFLADGYWQLLGVRLAMGVALGGFTPIVQSIVAVQSAPGKMGRNIGIQTLLMFLVGQMAGPLVTTRLAEAYGWQATYGASAVPFLILAVLVALLVKENPKYAEAHAAVADSEAKLSTEAKRTVGVCIAISVCFMLWLVIHTTFLSVYLVEVRGVAPTRAGEMLSVLGIAGAIGGLFLPMISDRLGKRTVLLTGMVLSLAVPMAVLFWTGPLWSLQLLIFAGWLSVGSLPIYAVLLPGETVPAHRLAVVIALIIGAGEVIGGIGGPIIAGQLADHFGLKALFMLTGSTACISVVLASRLRGKR